MGTSDDIIASQQVEVAEVGHAASALPQPLRVDGGLVVDVEGLKDTSGLKLAKDGGTILIPQPADHEGDPLNWSSMKKHLVLFTIAWGALCADFVGAMASAPIIFQAQEWHMSLYDVNQPTSVVVLFLGLGGLIWVPMVSYWGRAPVLFWTEFFGLLFTIGTALAKDFKTFFVLRIFTAIFITAAQTISLALLKDIFFFHERARKIGLWASLYICSPYIGPMLANFVVGKTHEWRDIYWMGAGVLGLQVILVLCFIDETWYNRSIDVNAQPARPQTFSGRMMRVLGLWQISNHSQYFQTVKGTYRALFLVILQSHFALIALSYFLLFMWAIGINITTSIIFGTPREFGGYGFNNVQVGYLHFSPIVGTLIAEVFGHWFNDFMARRYIQQHHGVFEPEIRLWPVYIAALFTIPGIIIVGQAVSRKWLWIGAASGWATFSVGIMLTSVAVTAYSLDSFPMAPAEVAAWLNLARTMGGFAVGYFQEPWGHKSGYDISFGVQAIIVAFSVVPAIVVHKYGHGMRMRSAAKHEKRGFF